MRMEWRCGMLATLWLAGVVVALPPTPLFETFGVDDGLPTTRIYEVVEDRRGFLWIATAEGLARYDGVDFAVWRRDPADPASLPANDVQTVFVDREDRVWLGTVDGGLSLLDPASGRVRRCLDLMVVEGIKTTLPLHRRIMDDADFQSGRLSTKFMERFQGGRRTAVAAS